MKSGLLLGGTLVAACLSTGCHRNVPIQDVHIKQPGVHVVGGYGSTSIVWDDGRAPRVCTLRGSTAHKGYAKKGRRGGKKGPMGAGSAHQPVDTLLFRLCEARGNKDLTAEEYKQILNALLAHARMHPKRGFCPHCQHHGRGMGPPNESGDDGPPEGPPRGRRGPGPGPAPAPAQ